MKRLAAVLLALFMTSEGQATEELSKSLQRQIMLGGKAQGLLSLNLRSNALLRSMGEILDQHLPAEPDLPYQEAIWELYDLGLLDEFQKTTELMTKFLKIAPVKRITYDVESTGLGYYQSRAFLVEYSHGVKAVFKPGFDKVFNYHHEIAAYELDKLFQLNLVPITVPRRFGGVKGSLQLFFPGENGVQSLSFETNPYKNSTDFAKQQLFDFLINHQDRMVRDNTRDEKNLLFSRNKRLALIDNGWAFREHHFKGSFEETTLFPKSNANLETVKRFHPGATIINSLQSKGLADLKFLEAYDLTADEVKLIHERVQDVLEWLRPPCEQLFSEGA